MSETSAVLDSIEISNFKSLRQVGLSFPRLTLLYGPNSSGKSSVFQALLAIKQTLESRNIFVPLVLSGRYVQLGSYESVVYGKDVARKISLEFKLRTPRLLALYGPRGLRPRYLESLVPSREGEIDLSSVIVGFTLEYIKSTRRIKLGETWVSDAKRFEIIRIQQRAITRILGKEVDHPIKRKTVKIGNTRFIVSPAYFIPRVYSERYRMPRDPEARSLYNFERILRRLSSYLEDDFTRKLLYLGPLRDYPKRYYFATGEVPRDVGLKGENVVELLYYDSKTKKRKIERIITGLKPWLDRFGLAKDVRIDVLPEGLYSLTLRDPYTKFDINVSDTGFGVSQVLPVIVECLSSPPGSTMLVEQPEIHVHPKVQAELGDLFIAASKERKIIVETHSEHILLRIQRRIAEGTLSASDVAIYYFDLLSDGTKVTKISLDELGSLKEWPPGFFEEDYQESVARYKAMLEKTPDAKLQ